MLDIGFQEMLVIGVLALLVFGPDKLPELGRKMGRLMREFRRASEEFRSTVETNLQLHEDILPPSATLDTPAPAPDHPVEAAATAAGGDAAPSDAGNGVPAEVLSTEGGGGDTDGQGPPFWTTRGGKLLHRGSCAWRRRVSADSLVPLETPADGWAQGLLACPACDPGAGAPVPAPV